MKPDVQLGDIGFKLEQLLFLALDGGVLDFEQALGLFAL
jgi:hypothetical protein